LFLASRNCHSWKSLNYIFWTNVVLYRVHRPKTRNAHRSKKFTRTRSQVRESPTQAPCREHFKFEQYLSFLFFSVLFELKISEKSLSVYVFSLSLSLSLSFSFSFSSHMWGAAWVNIKFLAFVRKRFLHILCLISLEKHIITQIADYFLSNPTSKKQKPFNLSF